MIRDKLEGLEQPDLTDHRPKIHSMYVHQSSRHSTSSHDRELPPSCSDTFETSIMQSNNDRGDGHASTSSNPLSTSNERTPLIPCSLTSHDAYRSFSKYVHDNMNRINIKWVIIWSL
ncbi:hypothetical protein AcW1_004262 [Taiwanofungus camphoratus]|nr:hypothetical protein AcV5_000643 [Antrodia cinnamomea]KAI0952064.1 hypothetical protein AcV7_007985 [Antrodia cinnamomea]KAI0959441.1 hypothetical protein AcW1_004262 [Antrodia cinnamomea]